MDSLRPQAQASDANAVANTALQTLLRTCMVVRVVDALAATAGSPVPDDLPTQFARSMLGGAAAIEGASYDEDDQDLLEEEVVRVLDAESAVAADELPGLAAALPSAALLSAVLLRLECSFEARSIVWTVCVALLLDHAVPVDVSLAGVAHTAPLRWADFDAAAACAALDRVPERRPVLLEIIGCASMMDAVGILVRPLMAQRVVFTASATPALSFAELCSVHVTGLWRDLHYAARGAATVDRPSLCHLTCSAAE
jgi:hypothetical protein